MIAALAIVVTWSVLFLLSVGVGYVVMRVMTKKLFPGISLERWLIWSAAPWLGLLTLVTFLQVWYLFLPINDLALLGFVVVGAIGLLTLARERGFPRRRGLSGKNLGVVALGLVVVLWTAVSATVPVTLPDFYGYELSIIQWAQEARALPGIANFEERLGYGSSLWLFAALLDTGPWAGSAFVLPNGLYVFFLVTQTVVAWLSRARVAAGAYRVFLALSVAVVFVRLSFNPDWWLAAPQPDLPAMVCILASASLIFGYCQSRSIISMALALLIAALGTLVRLTALPWLGVIVIFFFALTLRRGTRTVAWRNSLILIGCATVLYLPYASGRYLLTGYPLFPLTALGIGTPDWRLREATSQDVVAWYFSRNLVISQEQIDSGSWFPIFLRYLITSDTAVQGTVIFLLGAMMLWLLRGKLRTPRETGLGVASWTLIGFSAACLGAWIWASKQERFAWGYFALIGIVPLTYVISKYQIRKVVLVGATVGAVGAGVLLLTNANFLQAALGISASGKPRTIALDINPTGTGLFGLPGLPPVIYASRTTTRRLTYSLPLAGEAQIGGPGTAGGYCGRGLPECSANPNLKVERREGSFLGGFRAY